MVGVSAVGDPDSVRSLLESLTTVASPYPTIVKCVSSSRKMSVTIPAMVLDSGLAGATRGIKVTLSYHGSTNYIQVSCPATVEDAMVVQLAELEM
eukprot:4365035-Pyramimonas_sp.AAC.1